MQDNARQATQAKTAIGSGQVAGKGLFSLGGESRLSHIAEKNTPTLYCYDDGSSGLYWRDDHHFTVFCTDHPHAVAGYQGPKMTSVR